MRKTSPGNDKAGTVKEGTRPLESPLLGPQNVLRDKRGRGATCSTHRFKPTAKWNTKTSSGHPCLFWDWGPRNEHLWTKAAEFPPQWIHCQAASNHSGGHAQLDVAGQICQTELTSVRWNRPPGKGLQHNSVSVNYSLTECSFVVHRHQTEPHPFLRKCTLDAPTQFRGHGNCGAPVCAAEQQSGSVRGALLASDWMDASGTHNSTFNKDAELCTSNRQGTLSGCLGRVMQDFSRPSMLTTKDADKTNPNHLKCQAKVAQGDLGGPRRGSCAFSSKHTERAIREQIQRVVVNLEDVLHGLKEIHLEMKEVVQKIDLLTADIDVGHDEPGDTFKERIDTEGVCSNKSPLKTPTPSVAPPAYPIKDQGLQDAGQKQQSTQELVTSQRDTSGTAPRRRSKKPPPYPYSSTMGRVNPKDKGQTPPYPFRRRLLSTIV